jgi:hypothetical protein
MASLPSLFRTFLSNIRPSDRHIDGYKQGHETLRSRLQADDRVSEFYVGDFLQGSYRRWTAVNPIKREKSDVDIVLVTDLNRQLSPRNAMQQCEPFLNEYYGGQWSKSNHAYQIDADTVEIDLVLTAAPCEATRGALQPDGPLGQLEIGAGLDASESSHLAEAFGLTLDGSDEEWKNEPLDIPNRRLNEWDKTHPLATIDWTLKKNDRTDGHYVNVVKAIKWWRRTQVGEPERPKGYPLEHIVGCYCPDSIDSVAEGITRTFERIEREYETEAANLETPTLPARGLPDTDVLARLDGEVFASFYENVGEATSVARTALNEENKTTSREHWHDLFGDKFPEYGGPDTDDDEERTGPFDDSASSTSVSDQRFA